MLKLHGIEIHLNCCRNCRNFQKSAHLCPELPMYRRGALIRRWVLISKFALKPVRLFESMRLFEDGC